jgi:hypothetical protein
MNTKVSEQAKATVKGAMTGAAKESVAALRVLISGEVNRKVIPATDTRPDEIVIMEQAAVLIGGKTPLAFNVGNREGTESYKEGRYLLGRNMFKIGPFANLEFDRFAQNSYVFVGELTEEEKSFFEPVATDTSDLVG